ncbi:DNA2-like helicase [Papilio machaon]|uniref:DNA helicase n=1 Tax=Papilio machaon TaxID=76193 RepID=A0A0N1IHE3_PAPMA|nr:DNA2-like helicase [Papilio machaon]
MPKSLSLKKNHQVIAKNQKVITQFFKNPVIHDTQKNSSPLKKKALPTSKSDKNAAVKRKLISPTQTNLVNEIVEIPQKNSPTKNIFKKQKAVEDDNKVNVRCNLFNKENNEERTYNKKCEDPHELEKSKEKLIISSETDLIDKNISSQNSPNKKVLNENYDSVTKIQSPKKTLHFDNALSPSKGGNVTPKKFCKVSVFGSPNKEQISNKSCENSPSKSGSTIKSLQSCEREINNVFEDEWEMEHFEEVVEENLNLSTIQRCEVLNVKLNGHILEVKVQSDNLRATCYVEGIWLCLSLQEGDIVSILAVRNTSGQFHVNNAAGLIVFRPDYLLSSTSVVAGVFCQRKAVLQERWRGIDSANIAMTIGILIHELVQKALTVRIMSKESLRYETDKIIKESIQMLFDSGLSEEEARSNMEMYIVPLSEFMDTYLAEKPKQHMQKNNWSGHINKVLDIEENLCCPKLGLKGKIDATLEVTIHERDGKRREVVPLELKSGRATVSVEHRGQLVLYGMMLSLMREEDPTQAMQRGLLLYLKEGIMLREVSCGYPERRDLIMLRNQLVQYLTTRHIKIGKRREIVPLELKSGRATVSVEHRGQLVLYGMMLSLMREEDPTQAMQRGLLLYLKEGIMLREVSCGYPERRDLIMLRNQLVQYLTTRHIKIDQNDVLVAADDSDIEDKYQRLPEPVHREAACAKCPYLTICSLHLWHTDGPKVSTSHPLSKLRDEAIGHLSLKHIEYFLHWAYLLKLEEKVQLTSSPLHALWTDSVEKRMKRGTCVGNLKLNSVETSGHRYLHTFKRESNIYDKSMNSGRINGPQEGDFSIVSIEKRPWIAAGVVSLTSDKEIQILLERDLSQRQNKETTFHIDAYESYASTVQNLTNLGVLIEDSERALRLRRIIIDKEPPVFAEKLPRDIHRLGAKLMRSLNIEQQRAVFNALAAKDYALLQGLPGTGKTKTISVLIQMLVALKQRVLVTAHTHSAVDNVLARLPESIQILRLGSCGRVASNLLHRCEEKLTSKCVNSEQLAKLYDSMEVVGVTCLGAAHAMLTRTTFDVCIVDEATQVLQCTVLRPLFAAKRFVLVGDPEQLPPVVRRNAARQLGMEESLFHRLMANEATSTLRLQYRMNQPLTDLANSIAYSDRLKCANKTVADASILINIQKISQVHSDSWILTACSPEPNYAAIFINLENIVSKEKDQKTISNWEETCLVLAIVEAMKLGGVSSTDIGVIAPYRDQVSLLRRTLAPLAVEASTIDQFQGRDKSVIIYSCTKKDYGQKDKTVKEEEILNDQRRLAVSVTRAKHKFIVIGNSNALRRYEPLQRLIQACHRTSIGEDILNKLLNKYKTSQTN